MREKKEREKKDSVQILAAVVMTKMIGFIAQSRLTGGCVVMSFFIISWSGARTEIPAS